MCLTLKSSCMKKSLRLLWKLCKGNDWQATVGLICRTNAQSDHKSPWNTFSEGCISPWNDYRKNKIKKKKRLLKITASGCPSRKPLWRAPVPCICVAHVAHSAGLAFWGFWMLLSQSAEPAPRYGDMGWGTQYIVGSDGQGTHILWYPLKQCIFPHGVLCSNTTTGHSFAGRRGFFCWLGRLAQCLCAYFRSSKGTGWYLVGWRYL